MAPKITRTMDDARIPGAGGGKPIEPPRVGPQMGPGLLKANGPLQPSGATMTIAGPSNHTVGKPTRNG